MDCTNLSDKPLVSVVIPVYNVERYMEKCIESVRNQTLKNIEIILVDDGSTDTSGTKCDSYAFDKRVKIIHKKNGGLSDARNCGIKAASASYVGFIDSDDYIDEDMYEVLYQTITEENADIAFCGIYSCYASGMKPAYVKTSGRFITDSEGAIELVLRGKLASVSAVNKLYKRELLDEHSFPVGKTSEDAHFIIAHLTKIKKAAFDMSPKYYYIHREGTITTRPFRESDLSICEAYLNNRKIVKEMYPALLEPANFRYYWSLFYVLDKMLRTKSYGENGEKEKIIKIIKKNYKNIMRNSLVGRGRKVAVTGLMLNEFFYRVCLNAYSNQKKRLFSE